MRIKPQLLIAALLLAVGLSGCGYKPEQYARDSIAAAKGFLEKAQQHHGAECRAQCTLPTVKDAAACATICNAINRAVAAQNTAIDALNLYCAGPAYLAGGPCQPQAGLQPRLLEAVRTLDRILGDVRVLVKGAKP